MKIIFLRQLAFAMGRKAVTTISPIAATPLYLYREI